MSNPNQPPNLSKAKQPILVTAAVVIDKGLILIARRQLNATNEAGKWEFPGGKVEYGEHPEDGLVREILEELNLKIEVERFLDLSSHVTALGPKTMHVVLLCYICRLVSGELKLLDAADARWVKKEELSQFDFATADIPLVASLQRALAGA